MPYFQTIVASRQMNDGGSAVRTGLSEIGTTQDHDVRDHPIVDVAPERNDSGLVEDDRFRLATVERDLKSLGFRKRIDLGLHAISIRKKNAGIHHDRSEIGLKFFSRLTDGNRSVGGV